MHLTLLPEQKQSNLHQGRPRFQHLVKTDIADAKANLQALPTTPILATRPKRLKKPSLKVRENLGLAWQGQISFSFAYIFVNDLA